MRAFVLTKYGGPDVAELRNVPPPEPGRGEIRIDVKAAGLNPVDFKTREGKLRVINRYALPIVLGCELSGVVASVGEGGPRFPPGAGVFPPAPKKRPGPFPEPRASHEISFPKNPPSPPFALSSPFPP